MAMLQICNGDANEATERLLESEQLMGRAAPARAARCSRAACRPADPFTAVTSKKEKRKQVGRRPGAAARARVGPPHPR